MKGLMPMLKMKYVIVDIAFAELAPIVFREDLSHEMAVIGQPRHVVKSAGFVHLAVEGEKIIATAHGYSMGLKIGADVDRDSEILTTFFNSTAR